jgi:ribosome-associated protein
LATSSRHNGKPRKAPKACASVPPSRPEAHSVGSLAAVERQTLRVTSHLTIPLEELSWRFSGSGGPGGQHANTANTRVELIFDVATSPSLGPRQRARLLERFGPTVRVVASDERSQTRNRELALARLAGRLAGALKIQRPRRPTRPTLGAKERRLGEKRRQGQRKRDRAAGRGATDE